MSVQPTPRYTLAEYLDLERSTQAKHEYYRGQVFAMGGASFAHTVIVGNVAGELRNQLKGKPCRVSPTDLRVKVGSSGLYTYPDVVVVCGPPQLDQPGEMLLNPQVIVEVLSEGTEAKDRGWKFEQYRTIQSLVDYLLVSQDTPRIEHYQRQPDGSWLYTAENRLDHGVAIASIGCDLQLAEVYDKIEGLKEPGTFYRY